MCFLGFWTIRKSSPCSRGPPYSLFPRDPGVSPLGRPTLRVGLPQPGLLEPVRGAESAPGAGWGQFTGPVSALPGPVQRAGGEPLAGVPGVRGSPRVLESQQDLTRGPPPSVGKKTLGWRSRTLSRGGEVLLGSLRTTVKTGLLLQQTPAPSAPPPLRPCCVRGVNPRLSSWLGQLPGHPCSLHCALEGRALPATNTLLAPFPEVATPLSAGCRQPRLVPAGSRGNGKTQCV